MRYFILVIIAVFVIGCGDSNNNNNKNLSIVGKGVVIGNPIVQPGDSLVTVMVQYKDYIGLRPVDRIRTAAIPATVKISHGDSVTYICNRRYGCKIISVWKPTLKPSKPG